MRLAMIFRVNAPGCGWVFPAECVNPSVSDKQDCLLLTPGLESREQLSTVEARRSKFGPSPVAGMSDTGGMLKRDSSRSSVVKRLDAGTLRLGDSSKKEFSGFDSSWGCKAATSESRFDK